MKLLVPFLLLSCLFLLGCNEVVQEGALLEDPNNPEKTAEKPCIDTFGNPFGPEDLIVFWDYEKVESEGTLYRLSNLGIQFEYEGDQSLYAPITQTEEWGAEVEMEKFVKFSTHDKAICVGDSVANEETKVELYEDGVSWEDVSVKEWMEDISADEGQPVETVKFGKNTYSRIHGTNFGSGLVDFYFIEHNGDMYELSFAWTADGAFGQEWWELYPLPEEYEKVLETVEFL